MKALTLSILLVLSTTVTALSVSKDGTLPFTADMLINYCESFGETPSQSAKMFCFGYIKAITGVYASEICPPSSVKPADMRVAVAQYISSRPLYGLQSAHQAVAEALKKKWPCKE